MSVGFTIEGRARQLPDIQRTWLWELIVPNINTLTDGVIADEDDLVIRLRNAVIPSRANQVITSNFLGMTQKFPGKPEFGESFSVTIEEMEDQKGTQALYNWAQRIFDVEPTATGGLSKATAKRAGMATDIKLLMYAYGNTPDPMKYKILFVNAWPSNVEEVPLAYDDNAAVRYTVSFTYDFWRLVEK